MYICVNILLMLPRQSGDLYDFGEFGRGAKAKTVRVSDKIKKN